MDAKALSDAGQALYDELKSDVADLIASYKAAAADGITFSEVAALGMKAIASFMRIVELAGPASNGDDKKAVVLAICDQFYDAVIAPIDLPKVPDFIETRIVDPLLKSLFLKAAAGAIDGLAEIFNRTGWFDVPTGTNGANGGNNPAPPVTPAVPPSNDHFVPY